MKTCAIGADGHGGFQVRLADVATGHGYIVVDFPTYDLAEEWVYGQNSAP